MSLHLHGVVRAGHRLPDGSPLRLVALDDLAVVVSDGHALTEQEIVANLAALCALLPGGPVLPLRPGTTAVDETAARAAVSALTPSSLRHQLDQLDGMAELHVRVVFDEDTALRAVHDKGTFTGRGADPVAQGQLIAREIVAWRRKQADALLAPVSAAAKAVVLLDTPDHTVELRAYLLPLDRIESVRSTVDGVTYIGPLPAYNFLDLTRQPVSRWGW